MCNRASDWKLKDNVIIIILYYIQLKLYWHVSYIILLSHQFICYSRLWQGTSKNMLHNMFFKILATKLIFITCVPNPVCIFFIILYPYCQQSPLIVELNRLHGGLHTALCYRLYDLVVVSFYLFSYSVIYVHIIP